MIEKIFGASDIVELVRLLGVVGVTAVVFAESGLFFGFFLPGDSLLFTAGVLSSLGVFSYGALAILLPLAAISGDAVGYFFGRKMGEVLYEKEGSKFFKKKHIKQAEEFYKKYGQKAIVMARFIPVVRTFVPIVAGAARMEYRVFFFYNCIGGLLWTESLLLLGYVLGLKVSHVDRYLLPVVLIIILISFLPVVLEVLKNKKRK